jgi:phage recombination protein Bet
MSEKTAVTQRPVSSVPALAISETELMSVLENSLYPGAAHESIKMVISYCKASGLDPMQKPVHIVPIWDSKSGRMRDVIMPGIGLYRTQAARCGQYAGVSEPEFGPDVTGQVGGQQITYPAWCKVIVKRRLPSGEIVDFAATERWLENYAVKGGKEKSLAPNAMWTKRPYAQLAKCFDAETEVLTTHGFQRFSDVTGMVIQVTPDGMLPCDAIPFSQEYDGEMIVADGTRLNFAVTPNHDMLTTAGKVEAGMMFEQATKMGNKFQIPRAPAAPAKEAAIQDGVLKLAGYYLADGSHTGYRQFRIAVSRSRKVDALRELALHDRESVRAEAGNVAVSNGREIVTIYDKTVFTYGFDLIADLVSQDKTLNVPAVLALSRRQARVMADAILEFDGSETPSGVRRLTQANENVLRGFELLAVHGGLSVSSRTSRQSDIGHAYTVTVSEADHFPVVKGVEKNSASLVKRRNVGGVVWCVTVPSGVIVVRRHGFSMLCGNCAEAQALRKAFPEFGSQPTADEMEGKQFDDYSAGNTIDGATGEVVKQKPAEKPAYPEESFAKQLAKWIEVGTKSPEDFIAMLETKGTLTAEQKARVKKPAKAGGEMTAEEVEAARAREIAEAQNEMAGQA